MKYAAPAIVVAIIAIGVVIIVFRLTRTSQSLRDRQFLLDLHKGAIASADVDPTAHQVAHQIAEHINR